jgi:hypothetical protein
MFYLKFLPVFYVPFSGFAYVKKVNEKFDRFMGGRMSIQSCWYQG